MSSSKNNGVDDGSGCAFFVLVIVLAVALFAGEPDLVDALIYRLYDGNVPVVEEAAK